MFKELITAYAQNIKYVCIQNPAAPEQIRAAEKAVGCRFPDELAKLLSELNGDRWLLFSTDEIISRTENTREGLVECYPDIDRHIFFAGNGCGDYYCYNILPDGTADSSSIFIWEHETNETRRVASSISELIQQYYQTAN